MQKIQFGLFTFNWKKTPKNIWHNFTDIPL